ncbi:hypothetical protein TREMEDRAFT_66503 [Tremella mesenterica DSM 1558]|uniref:uncharacterized protein n=1 Tax=Tremella mesenterica (strain ATCC 24925 / CBS 8224 / DSM 1558 / NBRC 9311 / NRRL Y-6157 / RJB 2259-6 / UBC 559-6) TaxID=578456 RepID=UPI00032BBE8F|nr:uncharacterized protein TREMEDRAFT_66503 [Tremella mesenterica DSM 1558]EIW65512.1 hypothetical protein TREMEDRAFT_66503 [Tremella mesenterica DSM 1558]
MDKYKVMCIPIRLMEKEALPTMLTSLQKATIKLKDWTTTRSLLPLCTKTQFKCSSAVVNPFDIECDQVDIKAAFSNGKLEGTIYMQTPEGFNIPANKVLWFCKSLYD